jgi:hypothetical protein
MVPALTVLYGPLVARNQPASSSLIPILRRDATPIACSCVSEFVTTYHTIFGREHLTERKTNSGESSKKDQCCNRLHNDGNNCDGIVGG